MNDYWELAKVALAESDPVLGVLISRYPGSCLRSRGNAFETLSRAIVGQQISIKAADSVWQRLCSKTVLAPIEILALTPDELRSCGLSYRKAEYLQDLAQHFYQGLVNEAEFGIMSDEQVIASLIRIKGIGRWSAEMFLIFHLLRPNVFPINDMGLHKAMQRHYPHLVGLGLSALQEHAQRWQPWRSVATWYLWRSLDPSEVVY